jgi:pilus assembly protein Flp/PilA
MQSIWLKIRSFMSSEDGPTATEYAVMLAMIILVSLTVVQSLGITVSDMFVGINAAITS